jgi:antitoxin component of RelBE/YafQ-DinJ toxin-antitoxin module
MISRHAKKAAIAVRTDPEVRSQAKDALGEHGWEVAEFVVACLRAVAAEPERFLKMTQKYRVPSVKGRPRRSDDESP